jgi:hypothetical protein
VSDRVSIRAHYERFPATVKGAFVLRGADADPHQVRIESTRIAEAGGGRSVPIEVDAVTLDVAPHRDLFVPFEFQTAELGAGWYGLECDVLVDGQPEVVRPGPRFPVPWPRATTRRGTIPVRAKGELASGTITIEQIDCSGDSIKLTYAADRAVTISLAVDGTGLPVLESEFDESAGRGKVLAYPVLRTHAVLTVRPSGADPIDVRLD